MINSFLFNVLILVRPSFVRKLWLTGEKKGYFEGCRSGYEQGRWYGAYKATHPDHNFPEPAEPPITEQTPWDIQW